MRAMVVRRYGPPKNLELQNVPEPTAKADEVVIGVRTVGINFADLLQRMGLYPGTPKPPFIPGFEVAGVIERAAGRGDEAGTLAPGDRVVAMTEFRAYAERVATSGRRVYRIPDKMPFEDAAAMPVNYLTAYHSMFVMGNLQPFDRILIHGAAGGVGIAAVQLARARSLVIFGTAGPSKQDFLRQIGVQHPIDYSREDFVQVVRRVAPEGIEMVMDPIGGKSFARSYQCLGATGRLVIYGFSAAAGPSGKRSLWRGGKALLQTPRFHPMRLMRHSISVIGVHLGRRLRLFARVDEHILKLNMMAQVVQFTPEIVKLSGRLEATYGEKNSVYGPRLSRWDALHLATAIAYKCSRFLTLDEDLFAINFGSEAYMPNLVKPVPVQRGLQFDRAAASPPPP